MVPRGPQQQRVPPPKLPRSPQCDGNNSCPQMVPIPESPIQKEPKAESYLEPIPEPEPAPYCSIDYDKLLDKMAKDSRFRGPAGPQGPKGDTATLRPSDLDAIEQRIKLWLAANRDKFKGDQGPAGPPGQPGPPGISPPQEDAAALAKKIQPHLDPIWMRKVDASTGQLVEPPDPIHLGEGWTFYLHEQ